VSSADRATEQAADKSPEELREEIAETREQLGDTVEALAEKTDVKAQARRRLNSLKGTAEQKRQQVQEKAKAATPESAGAGMQQLANTARENPLAVAAAGAFLAGLLMGRWTKPSVRR
jgi:predicted Zn-dependent peptidase